MASGAYCNTVRDPQITRERMSRPMWSVPSTNTPPSGAASPGRENGVRVALGG